MKTVVEMAREAGLHRQQHNLMSNPVQYRFSYEGYEENLKLFAEIARAEEREACAKVCETLGVHPALNVYAGGPDWYKHGKDCAAVIRARGETK